MSLLFITSDQHVRVLRRRYLLYNDSLLDECGRFNLVGEAKCDLIECGSHVI